MKSLKQLDERAAIKWACDNGYSYLSKIHHNHVEKPYIAGRESERKRVLRILKKVAGTAPDCRYWGIMDTLEKEIGGDK